MFKLDDNLLKELGLGSLPAEEKNKMLAHIYETLEMRVGMKLAEQMTNNQLDEFEAFIDKNDPPVEQLVSRIRIENKIIDFNNTVFIITPF